MKTINQYETEKKVVKVVCIVMLVFFMFILSYIIINPNQVCYSDFCDFIIHKFFPITFSFFVLLPIFFIKEYYQKWKIMIIITMVATFINLSRPPLYDDFFSIGPKPTILYIYIISILVSCIFLYKQSNENN